MGEKGSGKEKKEESQSPVEVKLDMHCEGCAHKLRRAVLKGFKDAEKVATDAASNKLKVVGKVDPWKLKEFLESKTGKKVEFISPKDPPKKKAEADDSKKAAAGEDAKKAAASDDKGKEKDKDKDKKKSDDKKPKAPSESAVVLKIRLHCEGCIKRIKKNIYKVKGVKEVVVDAAKDLVTVKGTMDAKSLPEVLKERLNRSVEAVEPKKDAKGDGGAGEKKDKDGGKGGGGGENKDKGAGDAGKGGGEKKGEAEKPAAALPVPAPTPVPELNRMDYYGWYTPAAAMPVPVPVPVPAAELNRAEYYAGYGGYQVDMMHAPQLFSDENPNACSVM